MFAHPGAKLLFMGNEFGQTDEWNYKTALRWDLLDFDCHQGLKKCVAALSHLLKGQPALHAAQFSPEGFTWHDLTHREESVVAFTRQNLDSTEQLLVVLNMTPVERVGWTINVPSDLPWIEVFNSDRVEYWGTGNYVNEHIITPTTLSAEDLQLKIRVSLPPLGAIILKRK
jgi:1,4-alpha-glucan branching enzyme